jgi:hypothetical protein
VTAGGVGKPGDRLLTVGVDLASQPDNTAVCLIDWSGRSAEVRALARGAFEGRKLDDKTLLGILKQADRVAIDAPFGWPEPFIRAISSQHGLWPFALDEPRAPLERRTTDVVVYRRTGKLPLSVTTDRIAYCAMRCASILGALNSAKDGSGAVVEAYPDAALRCWLPALFTGTRQSYKTKDNIDARQRREALLAALLDELGDTFKISDDQRFDIADSDDCLDALVCALVACAAAKNRTTLPETPEHHELARIEGWIHLPEPDSLRHLTAV